MSDILVVVDMQNGFLRSESTQAVRKRIGTLINSGAFDYIIATDLFERRIRPVILVQYCGSNGGEESHSAGITCLKRLVGERQLYYKGIASKEDLRHI